MKIKNILSIATMLSLSLVLSACGNDGNKEADTSTDTSVEDSANVENEDSKDAGEAETPKTDLVKVTMVTDEGGVNDKSFNQSSFEGLTEYKEAEKIDFDYIESHNDSDYQPNLESALDSNSDIILTVGYALYQEANNAAKNNPEQLYVNIDNANLENTENLVGITFADHQNSFLAGYIAGMQTETNHVGFVGGQVSDVVDRFEYGFKAGVKKAADEKGEDIVVDVQYANSFVDQAAGKNIANQMYQQGADVVMHAAGGVGIGVIEAAKENNKWVIGVDRDQQDEAPDNMLVSTIKGVGDSVKQVIDQYIAGDLKGGQTITFTLADGAAVDLAYADNGIVSDDVKTKVEELRKEIIDGKIDVPQNADEFVSMGYGEEE